jgi:hypothetical protein
VKERDPAPGVWPETKRFQAAEEPANIQAVICLGRVDEEEDALHLANVTEVHLLKVCQHVIADPPVGDEGRLRLIYHFVRRGAPPTCQGPSQNLVVSVQQHDRPVAGRLVAGQSLPLEEEGDDSDLLGGSERILLW